VDAANFADRYRERLTLCCAFIRQIFMMRSVEIAGDCLVNRQERCLMLRVAVDGHAGWK
jgi:hypothetical protein